MSDQLERAVTTISVANEVTNYPVPLGELAELHSMNRLPSVLFLRFLSVEQVDGEEVTVCVGHQDVDPTTDQPDSGLRLVVSCREVVLPWWCLFWHPYAWWVLLYLFALFVLLIVFIVFCLGGVLFWFTCFESHDSKFILFEIIWYILWLFYISAAGWHGVRGTPDEFQGF